MSRPTPTLRTDYASIRTLTTRWSDNDIYGHMNNAVHYRLFDTAVNGFLIDHGILDLHQSATVFLVVESGCKFFSEMAFPDVISAGLRIGHLGTSSVRYELALFRGDAPLAAATGHYVHVNVDRNTRRPTPISEMARDALSALVRGD